MTIGVARHGAALVFRHAPPSRPSRRPLVPVSIPLIPRGKAAWSLDVPYQLGGAALLFCLFLSHHVQSVHPISLTYVTT